MSSIVPTYQEGEWSTTEFETEDKFLQFLLPLFKEPGLYEFDKTAFVFNEEARKFYKEAVQERQEKIQDRLDNAYSILIDEAPTIAKELLKTIKSDKIKSYTKSELFSNYFRIIERGWTDRKMAQQLHETREKIYQLENGRPLELTESPFDN